MSEIPDGWAEATVLDLAGVNGLVTDGDWIESKDQDPDGVVRLIQLADIGDGCFTDKSKRFLNAETAERLNCTYLEKGDLLIARMPEPLGRACLFPDIGQPAVTAVDVLIWRPDPNKTGADTRWLMHTVNSPEIRASIINQAGGTTRQRIAGGKLKKLVLRVPPMPEQRRIVVKVDGLTARTTRVRKQLDSIPSLIARYKSAVLSLAFKGDLTKDYRDRKSTAEANACDLPPNWIIKPLGEISDIQGGVQVGKKRPSDAVVVEVPYLRVANVQRGWLNLSEIKNLRVTPEERDRLQLRKGDILMNEGGDRDKLGRGWVWREEIPICIHQNHVFRIRLNDGAFPPEFISHYANENGQRYFFEEGKQTTNLASISKKKVSALPVPLPPTDEAIEIVRRIEATFAWLDRVTADHAAAEMLLAKLDVTILDKACRGELVPQDPNDEPASVLLERIKAGGAAAPKNKKPRKPGPKSNPREIKMMVRNLHEALTQAGGWISAQDAFQRCGIGPGASTEQIEALYAELRRLDKDGKLETEVVNDKQGRKLHDRLRLKAA